MGFPGDVTFVQLTGQWLDGSGQPVNADPTIGPVSQVVISPMTPLRFVDIASNTAIMPQRQIVNLTATGSVPPGTQVIATDTPALAGIAGFQYGVAVLLWDHLGAQLSPYTFILVAPTGTGPIDISAPQYAVSGSSVGVPSL